MKKTVPNAFGQNPIELTGATELRGLTVGQTLTKPDAGAPLAIRKAKLLTVVGFTEDGQVVIQITSPGPDETFGEILAEYDGRCFTEWISDINVEHKRDRGRWQYGCVGFGGA